VVKIDPVKETSVPPDSVSSSSGPQPRKCWEKPWQEYAESPVAPKLKKSAKRRRKAKQRKEALKVQELEDPLNLQAPVTSEATITTGTTSQFRSPQNPGRSGEAKSRSRATVAGKNPQSGGNFARETQATLNTPGPREGLKPKSAALGSSAMTTS